MVTCWHPRGGQVCTKTAQRVILEMAEAYNVFSRHIYFNPEMSDKYQNSIDRYIRYYTNIIRHVDIFLQEDPLMHTRLGFSTGSSAIIPTQHVWTGTQ